MLYVVAGQSGLDHVRAQCQVSPLLPAGGLGAAPRLGPLGLSCVAALGRSYLVPHSGSQGQHLDQGEIFTVSSVYIGDEPTISAAQRDRQTYFNLA